MIARADALRKLLALGDLYACEIHDMMGGDKSQTSTALHLLTAVGQVRRVGANGIGVRYQLATTVTWASA